jgi:exopolysaccharide biosynthesis protein
MMLLVSLVILTSCFRDESQPPATTINNTWRTIATGLEDRTLQIGDNAIAQLYIVRIDPTQYRFEVHYTPRTPYSIDEWRNLLPNAKLIVNANLFDADYNIVGLLIQNGTAYGWSYTDRGGTFAIKNNIPYITHNIYQPFDSTGAQYAIQGFPMLVYNGVQAFDRSGGASRRTAIGQDTQGRIYIMVTPIFGPSLSDLSRFLAESDLGLVNAFNLDGGRSTMIDVPDSNTTIRALDRVPAVLAIYPIER